MSSGERQAAILLLSCACEGVNIGIAMVESGAAGRDILLQVESTRCMLDRVLRLLVRDHFNHCREMLQASLSSELAQREITSVVDLYRAIGNQIDLSDST